MGRKTAEEFPVADGVLMAGTDLRRENLDDQAARRLMSQPGPELMLDLSNVRFVFSTYISVIGNLAQDCHNLGKRLTLRVPEKLGWVFRLDRGLDLFLRLETVKEED